MKKSRLKQIIREEYQNVTHKNIISEGMLDLILKLIFGGQIKKAVEKLKNDPELIDAALEVDRAIKDYNDTRSRYERKNREKYKLGRKILGI